MNRRWQFYQVLSQRMKDSDSGILSQLILFSTNKIFCPSALYTTLVFPNATWLQGVQYLYLFVGLCVYGFGLEEFHREQMLV